MTAATHLLAATRKVAAGAYIFRSGDLGDCAYLIDRGDAEIITEIDGALTPVSRLSAGRLAGEMAIIN